MNRRTVLTAVVGLTALALVGSPVFAQSKGRNGTTLAASKSLEICVQPDSNWRFYGEISVWNEGAIATENLVITDWIQTKSDSGQFQNAIQATVTPNTGIIQPGTTELNATIFPYSVVSTPLPEGTDIRNSATVTITNHSGQLGTAFGPNPKATYSGTIPPPACPPAECGCVLTQGYWKNHSGWPGGLTPETQFYLSGLTYQQVLDTPPPSDGGNYYRLAHQFIAAQLNQLNNACTPDGLFSPSGIYTQAEAWLSTNAPSVCVRGSKGAPLCGTQNTWAGILDDYNNGEYPDGPAHCAE